MLFGIDPRLIRFGQPQYLWFIVVTVALLALWVRQLWNRWMDMGHLSRRQTVPARRRFPLFGDLPFWLCLCLATALAILALAHPLVPTSLLRTAGVDLIILQDGSASMRVRDVAGDRWQRSMRFQRVLAESLRWQDDRVAMTVFAHIAAPQVRLTKDPNTFFFFLDHLERESPFRLDDDTTWDTNIELGVHWGLRLVERDEELNGRSPSAKVFVLISDGQTWSGEVEKAIQLARGRNIPIIVVGVGTTEGGFIPDAVPAGASQVTATATAFSPIRSTLDRSSLSAIATSAGGRYLELDRSGDREIASTIIDIARRRAGSRGVEEMTTDLYWPCLVAAGCCLCAGVLFLRERAEMWMQLAATGMVLFLVALLTR